MSARTKAPAVPAYADTPLREKVLRRIRNHSFDGGAVLAASEALAEHEAALGSGTATPRCCKFCAR